jgi:hypothetical protein
MNRTPADYGHIVLGEIDGREKRGAIEKIIAEARGEKPAGRCMTIIKSSGLRNSALTPVSD